MQPLWAFHRGLQSLAYLDPSSPGKALVIPIEHLHHLGWDGTDVDYLAHLPQLDATVPPPPFHRRARAPLN
jgi:hypothetical protein